MIQDNLSATPELLSGTSLNIQPDYAFIGNSSRIFVLLKVLNDIQKKYAPQSDEEYSNQMHNINSKTPKDELFNNEGVRFYTNTMITFKTFRDVAHPEDKTLVLVFFTDKILNLKAEQMKMKAQL